jgi:hypothetical protein
VCRKSAAASCSAARGFLEELRRNDISRRFWGRCDSAHTTPSGAYCQRPMTGPPRPACTLSHAQDEQLNRADSNQQYRQ